MGLTFRLAIVFCLAVGATGCDLLKLGNDSPTSPSDPPTTIRYAAIGASDVTGFGSSGVVCIFSDCQDGLGYVFVAARTLRARGSTVTVANLGIPTAVISRRLQVLAALSGQLIFGNFIDGEAPFVPTDTTLVTIFAGGNDVNVITGALGGGAGASDQAGYIDQQVVAFGADYAALLAAIRARAPSAKIIALNLPNLGALPFLADDPLDQKRAAQRISVRMTTTVVNALTSQNIRVVDLMCDPRFYQASTYSSDGFHPNDAGYAIMGDLVVSAVTAASYPNPRASCAQMTLIP